MCQCISYLRLNDYLPFFVLLVWPRETWCGFRFMWFISSTKLNRSKMVLSTIHNLRFFKMGSTKLTKQVKRLNMGIWGARFWDPTRRLPRATSTTAPALRGSGPPRCLARGAPPGWPRTSQDKGLSIAGGFSGIQSRVFIAFSYRHKWQIFGGVYDGCNWGKLEVWMWFDDGSYVESPIRW